MKRFVVLFVVFCSMLAIIPALAEESSDMLEKFLYTITPDAEMKAFESQAKEFGLYVNSKRSGTGEQEYRIALSKDVADVFKPTAGSVITATFDKLNKDSLVSVEYFDENKMIAAFWSSSDGYTMIDYNDPAHYSGRVSIDSFASLQGYQPSVVTDDNLLETIFLSVSAQMTKDAVISYVEENGLYYNSRGAGNYKIISYDRKVGEKYGYNGSYLIIDFTSDGYVSKLEYYDYILVYWGGCHAAFYTQEYPYSDYDGFCIVQSRDHITPVDDARTAIDEIKSLRHDVQQEHGYAD